jgi:hypothetical protein
MLIIENIDTFITGIGKIRDKINNIEKASVNINLNLSSNEKQWLNILINDFKINLIKIEKATKLYNTADRYEQQQLINITLDLYNDVNKVTQVL